MPEGILTKGIGTQSSISNHLGESNSHLPICTGMSRFSHAQATQSATMSQRKRRNLPCVIKQALLETMLRLKCLVNGWWDLSCQLMSYLSSLSEASSSKPSRWELTTSGQCWKITRRSGISRFWPRKEVCSRCREVHNVAMNSGFKWADERREFCGYGWDLINIDNIELGNIWKNPATDTRHDLRGTS